MHKSELILEKLSGKKVGVFCDDSNLYHAYKKYGWRIDFIKLKQFLGPYCDLKFINYYIAVPEKSDADYHGVQNFLKHIAPIAVVKTKPVKYIKVGNTIVRKGDVDVEMVLDVVRTLDQLDAVVVLSGDSDMLELKNYVIKDKNKIIVFMGYQENMAWELWLCWHIYLNNIKSEIILNNKNKPQV